MKSYSMFICEICKKESSDVNTIKECEASHYGITAEIKERWDLLNALVEGAGIAVSKCKNYHTEKVFDDAITMLVDFENEYDIKILN